jgi:hypothetical protein
VTNVTSGVKIANDSYNVRDKRKLSLVIYSGWNFRLRLFCLLECLCIGKLDFPLITQNGMRQTEGITVVPMANLSRAIKRLSKF